MCPNRHLLCIEVNAYFHAYSIQDAPEEFDNDQWIVNIGVGGPLPILKGSAGTLECCTWQWEGSPRFGCAFGGGLNKGSPSRKELLDAFSTQLSVYLRLQMLSRLALSNGNTVRTCTCLFSAHITCTQVSVPVRMTDYIAVVCLDFLTDFNYYNM